MIDAKEQMTFTTKCLGLNINLMQVGLIPNKTRAMEYAWKAVQDR